MGIAESSKMSEVDSQIALNLPSVCSIGLGMAGERDAAPIVGASDCHGPFGQAGIIGGDRIVSVNGTKVKTVADFWATFALARPERSIEFVILTQGGQVSKTVILEFPSNWWLPRSPKQMNMPKRKGTTRRRSR